MTATYTATDKEMITAIYNCYPCKFSKFNAMIYYKRFGVFPFDPSLN